MWLVSAGPARSSAVSRVIWLTESRLFRSGEAVVMRCRHPYANEQMDSDQTQSKAPARIVHHAYHVTERS